MPPLPKPPERRQRRNNRGDVGMLAPVASGQIEVPPSSKKWTVRTVGEWQDYFESPLAQLVVTKADLPALRRLFDYRDELRRALRKYRTERVVTTSSTGTIKLSPMADAIARLERLIAPLEDRFGMTPLGRLKLGASLGAAEKSLADVNADLDSETDDDDDPRFDVIDGTTTDEGTAGL